MSETFILSSRDLSNLVLGSSRALVVDKSGDNAAFCIVSYLLSVSMRNVIKYGPESENVNTFDCQSNKLAWFWDPCHCTQPVKQILSKPGMVTVNLAQKNNY